jgi:cysteine desulfurase
VTIYLDNLAATPIDPRIAARHQEAMTAFPGNAHSAEHSAGLDAQRAIDDAAAAILVALKSPGEELLFTPGASAALWLAVEDCIARTTRRPARIAASAAEHPSLLSALRRAERAGRATVIEICVDADGAPRLEAVELALNAGSDLVCTMAANNEVGTISDLAEIGRLVAAAGARHLVDASQAAGKIAMHDAIQGDVVVVSGAKMYGPRRSGALIGRLTSEARDLAHDLFGSPDTPSAIALSLAMELRERERAFDEQRLARMRDKLQIRLEEEVPGIRINGALESRLSGSLHVSTPNLPGEAVVAQLYGRVAISTGAACRTGTPAPSHVLEAMSLPQWAQEGAVRIGLGRFNTEDEVEEAAEMIAAVLGARELDRRCA